ncbi:MAG: flavodoxin [Pseudobutyrivibrio sp.]|nr:flavodoxin [Pseudobutyrivibrio sp.]
MSTLVTYFSLGGTTAKIAKEFADSIGADVFEIKPATPYTEADVKYTNPVARCNKEQFSGKDIAVEGTVENFEQYDTVYVGFPIWYAGAPLVVRSFCKQYDWTGKNVCAFATSALSKIGKTAEKLEPCCKNASSVDAKLVFSAEDVKNW